MKITVASRSYFKPQRVLKYREINIVIPGENVSANAMYIALSAETPSMDTSANDASLLRMPSSIISKFSILATLCLTLSLGWKLICPTAKPLKICQLSPNRWRLSVMNCSPSSNICIYGTILSQEVLMTLSTPLERSVSTKAQKGW